MAPISPFFLFKDPSQIQWSGNQRLTSNQLRGFGDFGFDPNISIGDIIPGVSQPGTAYQAPGTRGIFQDGIQIGSTSERNVIETPGGPGGEGFSLFTSTAANGQATDALPETVVSVDDDEGALPPEEIDMGGYDPTGAGSQFARDAAADGTEFEWTDPGEWKSPVTGWGTPNYNPDFTDPDLTEFTNQHFRTAEYGARYGSGPGEVFQSLGADPVVQMIVQGQKLDAWLASQGEDVNGDGSIDRADYPDRNVPRPSDAQMSQFRARFFMALQEREDNVQRHIEVIFGSPAFSLGFPTTRPGLSPEENLRAGLLDLFQDLPGDISTKILGELGGLGGDILTGLNIPGLASDIGTGIRGAIDPLTGADFGLDVIERDIFGEGGLEEKLRGLGLGELAAAITLQGTRLGELRQQLSPSIMKFPTGFVDTVGTLEDQLGGITDDLGVLGASPVPNALFRNLQRSQGLLDDIIGGSFGGEGYGFPAQRTGLAKALGQGEDLETLLGGLPAPPDLSLTGGPLDQARLLNELFTLGGTKLAELDTAMGELPPLTLDDLLPGEEELTTAWDERKPGPLAIDDLLPSRDLLREQLAYRAPSRLTAGELLPDEGILGDAWTAMRPDPLTAGDLLPDEGILGDAWTAMRPDPLTARGMLPTDLMDEWNLMRPQQLLSGDLLPIDMDEAWTAMRPEQLTIDDLLPSRGELLEQFRHRAPSPLTAGQLLPDMDALRGEFESLGLGPLNALLDRLDLGGLDPLGDLAGYATDAGPLNDLLAGIQAGDFGRLPDLLANAGVDINLPGLDRIETLLGPLTLLPGMGGQIKGLTEDLPREIQKVNDLINQRGGGGGAGGVTDISGLEDSLADILARLDTADGLQPSGSGGVFEELLGAIRPGFTDIRSQIQEMTAELIPQIRAELVADGFEGDIDAEATRRAQAQAAGILRSDPITASILADQEEQDRLREREDRELLQRFGVLRGGQTIDLANLRADDQSRAVLAALGQGAERADERFTQAIGAGTDIAGLLERRELARAGELGFLDGQRTLAGQDQDQALLATIVAMLQKEFDPLTTDDRDQAALVRSLMPLLPPEMRRALEEMLRRANL